MQTITKNLLTLAIAFSTISAGAASYDFDYSTVYNGVFYKFDDYNGAKMIVVGANPLWVNIVIPETIRYKAPGYNSYANIEVTEIADYGLYSALSMQTCILPETLKHIGKEAFKDDSELTTINIPQSVTKIDYDAFSKCNSLERVDITNLEKWININFNTDYSNPLTYAGHLYLNDEEIIDLVIPEGCVEIKPFVFRSGKFSSVTLNEGLERIGSAAFRSNSLIPSITVPASVNYMGDYAFYKCNSLRAVHVSDLNAWVNINFGNDANPLCNGAALYVNDELVTNLNIPEDVEVIKANAFQGCSSIESVNLPEGLAEIGSRAFYKTNISDIIIPSSVLSIGYYAFYYCDNLTEVYCEAAIPPTVSGHFSEIFSNPENMILHVPVNCENLYENAVGWDNFGTILGDLTDLTTGVSSSLAEPVEKADEIYTLNGTKINTFRENLTPGLYIINGRKVMIRQ